MIPTVIIEDELAAFENLRSLLNSMYGDTIQVIGHATSVEAAIQLISNCTPQLVFLDIQLQDGNGFEILDHFTDNATFEVIFTTGLMDYKEKAMDYFAFYYLNKPIEPALLKNVIDTYLAKKTAFDLEKYMAFKNQIEHKNKKISLPVSTGNFIIVDIDSIVYCEAEGSYTNFFTSDGKKYVTSNNLKKIESILQHSTFFRIHRSVLLNLKHVVQYNNSGELKLSINKSLKVSSRNKKNFMRVLKLLSYSI